MLLLLSRFSRVRLCVTPQMAAHQAPQSLGFSRQEHWSGLPFPSPISYYSQLKILQILTPLRIKSKMASIVFHDFQACANLFNLILHHSPLCSFKTQLFSVFPIFLALYLFRTLIHAILSPSLLFSPLFP